MMRKIWKYASRRSGSFDGGAGEGGGGAGGRHRGEEPERSPLRGPDTGNAGRDHWNGGPSNSPAMIGRTMSPALGEGGTQEALIAALQNTVLEQSQRVKDLSSTVDRLHIECRQQVHHVQALQRILQMIQTYVPPPEEMEHSQHRQQRRQSRNHHDSINRSHLLPTPIPPQYGIDYSKRNNGLEREEQQQHKQQRQNKMVEEEEVDEEVEEEEGNRSITPASGASFGVHDMDDQGGGELGPTATSPSSWRIDPGHISVEDASSILMGQILEKLHLAEDRVRIQEEELKRYGERLEIQDHEIITLEENKTRNEMLLNGLKKELSAFNHKSRARDFKEANMEVEIDRYRLQRRSMSKMLSNVVDENGTPLHESFFSTSVNMVTTNSPADFNTPVRSVANSAAESSPSRPEGGPPLPPRHPPSHLDVPATPPILGSTRSSPSRGPQTPAEAVQLRIELAALQAELEAARSVSEIEVRKRVAAEHEVEMLRRIIEESGVKAPSHGPDKDGKEGDEDDDDAASDASDGKVTSMVLKEQLSSLRDSNPAFQSMWSPATTAFKVRGKSYMTDGVKVDAHDPLFELVHMELLDVETLEQQRQGGGRVTRADHITDMFKDVDGVYTRCRLIASRPPPFLLILNFQIPGSPACSMMVYFALSGVQRRKLEQTREKIRRKQRQATGAAVPNGPGTPSKETTSIRAPAAGSSPSRAHLHEVDNGNSGDHFYPPPYSSSYESKQEENEQAHHQELDDEESDQAREEETGPLSDNDKAIYLFAQFLEANEEYRSARFKLIPSVVEGSYVIRYSVGNKPVILGNKLTQRYWSGPGYLEIGIDIGSSSIASRVVSLVRDFSKSVAVEIAVLVQGESEEELPEKILGSVCCSRVDWALAESLAERLTQATTPRAGQTP